MVAMTNDEMKELNKTRRNIQLQKVIDLISTGQKEAFNKAEVYKDGVKINLMDIDFNQDLIFITDTDFLGIISYCGLIKLNKININDDSTTGLRSRIRTNYMIVSAADARFAMLAYDLSEFDPDGWRIENYSNKDLILWNLPKLLGTGTDKDTSSILNSINSLYDMRRFNRKLNWMFFTGTEQEFQKIYNIQNIPVYIVKVRGYINNTNTSKGDIF